MGLYKRVNNKSGKDIWYILYYHNGKRYRERIGENKSEAKKALIERKHKIHTGKFDFTKVKAPVTFERLVERYQEYIKAANLLGRGYQNLINRLQAFFGGKPLSEITPFLIRKYMLERQRAKRVLYKVNRREEGSKPLAPASINRELQSLSKMLSLAVEEGWIEHNPMRRVKLLREDNVVDRILAPEEAERLLAACDTERYPYLKPLISLLLNTLMRLSEALSLRWEQVDFASGRITLVRTKNGKAREIDMNPIVREVLSTLRRGSGDGPYVFPHRFKKDEPRINPDYDALDDACQKAGIGRIGFHTFRHTGASWLMAAGVDIETVRVMGGWSDYKILMRYCHTTREQKRRAANVLATLISTANLDGNSQKTAKISTAAVDRSPQVIYNQARAHSSVGQSG